MSDTLKINGSRLWDSLMQMAEIGTTKKGGCNRQALTSRGEICLPVGVRAPGVRYALMRWGIFLQDVREEMIL